LNPQDSASQSGSSAGLSLSRLPSVIADKAAERLSWVALGCAVISAAMYFIQDLLQPEIAELHRQTLPRICVAAVVLMSLGLVAARYFAWLETSTILWLGLAYEVFGGFIISVFDYMLPWTGAQAVRGISWMAIWITMGGLMIPNRPLIVLAAALATASMGPLAYVLIYRYGEIPLNRLLIWNVPTFLVAAVTVVFNRRLYRLEVDVQRAKELGSYQLGTLLGRGGMGEVWRARHRLLARDAAVKLIRQEVLTRTSGKEAALIRRRFEQEAKATAALRCPHTVALYDFGVADGGDFYYVMELLEGIDLETLVKRFGPQPPERVAHILHQACRSLAEAHSQGMVHRDIKPTNLFVCRMGMDFDFTKVLDFGLVKAEPGEGESRMTLSGATTGTPAYMPPEIAMGADSIDGRADLYGLGCVAYWLLTGRLVFEEKGSTAMILAHIQKPVVPPSRVTEIGIPQGLERLVLACLEKRPENRPAGAADLARALEESGLRPWSSVDAEHWWRTNLPDGRTMAEAKASTAAAGEGCDLTATL
jgi:serine/threonine-protein kinase